MIEGINKKKATAYRDLYNKYYPSLCSYVSSLINSEEDSEDLVQEVIVAIYEGNHKFQDIRELTNYLYKASYNKALSFIRNNKIHSSILEKLSFEIDELDEETIYLKTVREETIRQLYIYVKDLPEEQRRIMLLRLEGLDWNEIANKLGISINTVKTQRMRSYKFLRQNMKISAFVILYLF